MKNDMNMPLREPALWLPTRTPVALPDGKHQTVVCEAGTVWITQGDGDDYVLNAGQSLALQPKDKVIVTAMFAPALVRCEAQRVERTRFSVGDALQAVLGVGLRMQKSHAPGGA